jgi:hypothetical protein
LNDPVRRGGLSVPPDLADESYLPLNPAASCWIPDDFPEFQQWQVYEFSGTYTGVGWPLLEWPEIMVAWFIAGLRCRPLPKQQAAVTTRIICSIGVLGTEHLNVADQAWRMGLIADQCS